jgi:ATPase subunit of ABC transporter with duplicated ATPase domains
MLEFRELSHAFLRKNLFLNVSLRLLPNERYGVVGANGSGKSTLLKILARELESDGGQVI